MKPGGVKLLGDDSTNTFTESILEAVTPWGIFTLNPSTADVVPVSFFTFTAGASDPIFVNPFTSSVLVGLVVPMPVLPVVVFITKLQPLVLP